MLKEQATFNPLPKHLQARLDTITQAMPSFWERNHPYNHFTIQGTTHSKNVVRILVDLIRELPSEQPLTYDESFILQASAWLYETGMQSPILETGIDIKNTSGFLQLQKIRKDRHKLSKELILFSIKSKDERFFVGLVPSSDEYNEIIADVCGRCSEDLPATIEQINSVQYVEGRPIRFKLLVALLWLADQLYIDRRRIRPELIEQESIPNRQLARWRVYDYVQILPIDNGQISFLYSLPEDQKDILGFVRGLIEPDFSLERNIIMQVLGRDYHLRLMPPTTGQEGAITKFLDKSSAALQLNPEYLSFVRKNVSAIGMLENNSEDEQCLLILDYTNFIIQLGCQGFAHSVEILGRLFVHLRNQAMLKSTKVNAWAVGPWTRPDMVDIVPILRKRVYNLLNAYNEEDSSQKITDNIFEQLANGNLPKRIILVTPGDSLASTIQQLSDRGYSVCTWINNVPDAQIFEGEGFGQESSYLDQLLDLEKEKDLIGPEELSTIQETLTLAIDNEKQKKRYAEFNFSDITQIISQTVGSEDNGHWWLTYLIDIDIVSYSNEKYILNSKNDLVVKTIKRRDLVISVMESLTLDMDGVREDILIKEIKARESFLFKNDSATKFFLDCLKNEEILRRKTNTDYPLENLEGIPFWQLNFEYHTIALKGLEKDLSSFILALENVMINLGVREHHQHTLAKHLARHIGENTVERVYDLAVKENLLRIRPTKEPLTKGNGYISYVAIAGDNLKVLRILRNRSIILNYFLKNKFNLEIPSDDVFWERLCQQTTSFSIPRDEFQTWMKVLLVDKIIMQITDVISKETKYRLNPDSLILRNLYAKLYLPELIRTMRRLNATAPERGRENADIVSKLSQQCLSQSTGIVAQWALEFAQKIKLINNDGTAKNLLWLNRQHSYLNTLDHREVQTRDELRALVKRLYRGNETWVPKALVIAEMDKALTFGYARQEQEYWLEQAIYRTVLIQESRPDRHGKIQLHIKANGDN